MSPTLTTETTAETTVAVSKEIAARVSALLSTYHELKVQADLLSDAMDVEKAKIFAILQEEGIEKVAIDGTPCTIVRGTSSSLDKMKFVELGGSLEMLQNATVIKPKKPYLKIGAEKS